MKLYKTFSCVLLLGMLLGVYKGKIALWKDGDPQPKQVFPFAAKLLPKAEREALEKGIRFESEEELWQLLAEYMS